MDVNRVSSVVNAVMLKDGAVYGTHVILALFLIILTVISGKRFEEERNSCGILDSQSK